VSDGQLSGRNYQAGISGNAHLPLLKAIEKHYPIPEAAVRGVIFLYATLAGAALVVFLGYQ
jgi:hypothetical protein